MTWTSQSLQAVVVHILCDGVVVVSTTGVVISVLSVDPDVDQSAFVVIVGDDVTGNMVVTSGGDVTSVVVNRAVVNGVVVVVGGAVVGGAVVGGVVVGNVVVVGGSGCDVGIVVVVSSSCVVTTSSVVGTGVVVVCTAGAWTVTPLKRNKCFSVTKADYCQINSANVVTTQCLLLQRVLILIFWRDICSGKHFFRMIRADRTVSVMGS